MAESTPVRQSLYPTMNTLQDARDYITSQLPITDPNELHACLALYQNTMMHVLHPHEPSTMSPLGSFK